MTRIRPTIHRLGAAERLVTDVAALGASTVAGHNPLYVGYVADAPRHDDSINLGTGQPTIQGERHGATAR